MPKLNREWVLQNLRETVEHIESVIRDVEEGDGGAWNNSWAMAIYRDLNRAWNGRFVRSIKAGLERDNELCRFPTDVDVAD